MLLVEHDVAMVLGLSSFVLVLDFGICNAQDTPDEIGNDPAVVVPIWVTTRPWRRRHRRHRRGGPDMSEPAHTSEDGGSGTPVRREQAML